MNDSHHSFNRRKFLTGTLAAGIGLATGCAKTFSIVPRHVLGGPHFVPPSEKVRLAKIGCGGMGQNDLSKLADKCDIVGLCDVDFDYAAESFAKFPNLPVFKDYRKLLDALEGKVDAVHITTPDHTHAPISLDAMRRGLHVMCQKPLTHNIKEIYLMQQAARKYGVATQMGNQGHAGEGIRFMEEWMMHYKVIGEVREAHLWTDRWQHDFKGRPTDTPAVPANLDWDLWLGPAPERPYHPCYTHGAWRAWWDFGCGALGDIGCHTIDAASHIFKLGYPTSVEMTCEQTSSETSPAWTIITYLFPQRTVNGVEYPPFKLVWYDGHRIVDGNKTQNLPPRPKEFPAEREFPGNGQIFFGSEGCVMAGMYGEDPYILPEARRKEFAATKPEKILPRSKGIHDEFLEACKGGPAASSNFEVSGALTEIVHLGNLAIKTGRKVEFDPKKKTVLHDDVAEKLLGRDYRPGWKLKV